MLGSEGLLRPNNFQLPSLLSEDDSTRQRLYVSGLISVYHMWTMNQMIENK